MKRIVSLCVIIFAAMTLMAQNNVITYTAKKKLNGLKNNSFNVRIQKHTFSNGTGTIVFSDDVTSIGTQAFSRSNITSIIIPSSVTSLGVEAFSECNNLTGITMQDGVMSIGYHAFYLCNKLTSVTIPQSVTKIAEGAFGRCSGLERIEVKKGNVKYDSRDDCNALIESETNTLIAGCMNTIIPNTVTCIGENAFEGMAESPKLTSFYVPNSVTDIKRGAFYCSSIKNIELPSSLLNIGPSAFASCYNLSSITIPSSVTHIDQYAFALCSSLKSVSFSAYIARIDDSAFKSCNSRLTIYVSPDDYSWFHSLSAFSDMNVVVDPQLSSDVSLASANANVKPISASNPALQKDPVTTPRKASLVDTNIPATNMLNEKTFAVIIANEDYQEEANVPYAKHDGDMFRQYCVKTLGIPSENIHYRQDATLNNIRKEINWIKQVCEVYRGSASVIFYYAGHGIPDEHSRSSYLLPVDGSGNDVSTGYKLDDLYATLGNMPARHITIFMDACFSGTKREGDMLASARGVALKVKAGVPQGNMVVFSAAQGDETAYPDKEQGHGMFTYYLLKKLQESKGDVTLQELGNYITTNVRQQSIVLNGKSQTPTVTPAAAVAEEWGGWKLK